METKQVTQLIKPERWPLPAKAEAEKCTEFIKLKARKLVADWWVLGLEVKQAIDDRVPKALGLTVRDWMQQCFGESLAKMWRVLRIARALEGVPETQVALLSEGNAYTLTQLPEEMRYSPKWIDAAIQQPNDEFQSKVRTALKEKFYPDVEPTVRIVWLLPESIAQLLERCIHKSAEVAELDLEGNPGARKRALEYILASYDATPQEILKAELE